jgi:phosphoadenosine phosphosulfate reductase
VSITELDVRDALDLEGLPAEEVIRWAVGEFAPSIVLTASMADAVMIDLVARVAPDTRVIFLDTGFHFGDTLHTVERVRRRYPGLLLDVVGPGEAAEPIYLTGDLDRCCEVNKVAPFDAALEGQRAWLTGLRRVDAPTRANTSIAHWDDKRGLVKVNPIAAWSDNDVDRYIAENDVIVNPLLFEGYLSIGCAPCTQPIEPGDHPRSGRWAGSAKTECGLHV